ncbi:gamma-glutamyltranspeptidase/glutathione hydrolase [Croceicoccus naphthovorans]|nr:gamma-glutamyltransferase [Croceicoccus naphthovorans]MBB3989739.1 gamma-glutamyltranspeptidase/glutathione hydrolase [Croceicoccus naphthovorans]
MIGKSAAGLIACLAAFALAATAQAQAQDGAIDRASEIGGGARPVGEDWSRSPVYAQHGMAATAHPLATQVALDILKAGGSAVDAAIAANAALGLMEPTGNGIGGDLFAIVLDPKTGELNGINGSGRSPQGQTLADLKAKLGDATSIPPVGPLPVTVPGTVDAWFEMHGRYGKLPMSEVLAPAVRYAREGHPVAPVIAYYYAGSLRSFERRIDMIGEFDNARSVWFSDGAPKAGEVFRNPKLADTLETIGRDGRDAFYKGALARTMAAYLERVGSALRYEDFAAHRSQWAEPTCVAYKKGYELCEMPPNGQGFAALQMVNILKNVDLSRYPRGSAEVLHWIPSASPLPTSRATTPILILRRFRWNCCPTPMARNASP